MFILTITAQTRLYVVSRSKPISLNVGNSQQAACGRIKSHEPSLMALALTMSPVAQW